jgi:hypothetical protein
MPNRICFVELPTAATGPAKSFYADAFGFAMADFGPTYACTMTGDVDLFRPMPRKPRALLFRLSRWNRSRPLKQR